MYLRRINLATLTLYFCYIQSVNWRPYCNLTRFSSSQTIDAYLLLSNTSYFRVSCLSLGQSSCHRIWTDIFDTFTFLTHPNPLLYHTLSFKAWLWLCKEMFQISLCLVCFFFGHTLVCFVKALHLMGVPMVIVIIAFILFQLYFLCCAIRSV